MKCKVCGKRFKLRKDNKYDIRKTATISDALSGKILVQCMSALIVLAVVVKMLSTSEKKKSTKSKKKQKK